MNKHNDFYVYEWFNVDTKEVFYVGKGRGQRYKNVKQRNSYFINYHNKYKCDVRKVRNKLEENESFKLEIELIKKYKDIGQCKCNLSEGGEGSTFPEGSWNDLFRKLQYSHDVRNSMGDMDDEEEYDYKNLKLKSLEELTVLHQKYMNHIENKVWLRSEKEDLQRSGYLEECLTDFEFKIENEEITMLSDILSKDIATKNKEFRKFLKYKKEIDFICCDFDIDKFLSLMINNVDYYGLLVKVVMNTLLVLKKIGNNPFKTIFINIKSYNIKSNDLNIKFNTSDDKTLRRVKIDLYDIVWGILIFKDKALFQIINDEIFSAPFI